jgi:predicted lipoprotein with Yx(FWY)xxD motif
MLSRKFIYACISFLGVLLFVSPINAELPQKNGTRTNGTKTNSLSLKFSNDPKLGDILTDSRGMTLYTYTEDSDNVSNCYGQCAALWPPFTVENENVVIKGLNGELGIIKRTDNKFQVTYNHKPLYYYVKDKNPGDTLGHAVDNKWYVIKK